ncbi:hypothetical protein EDD22DRAFT_166539 [Suillus occidentalis]|nr:hypothetical protein EDD22DRAFT_166539 [Suillus occidentalis]
MRRKRQAVVKPQQSLSLVQLWSACMHALANMDAVNAIITARKKKRIVCARCRSALFETESGLHIRDCPAPTTSVIRPDVTDSHIGQILAQSHRLQLAGPHSVSSNPISNVGSTGRRRDIDSLLFAAVMQKTRSPLLLNGFASLHLKHDSRACRMCSVK